MDRTTKKPQKFSDTIVKILTEMRRRPGALLPALHAIQDQCGYLPPESVPEIAKALNVSRAEVHGVISFYHYFKTTPPGRHIVQVCRAESCQSMGGRDLESHAKTTLNIDYHQTTADGAITLEPVYCLGNCAASPALRIDSKIYASVTPNAFDGLIHGLQEPIPEPIQSHQKVANSIGATALHRVFVPRDTTAISLGSDVVAERLESSAAELGLPVTLARNGSRGLYYLEPMIEVETERGRIAYGPVKPEDVDSLITAAFWRGNPDHPLYLGLTEEIPFLSNQQRLTFSRVGLVEPHSIESYQAHDGYSGLRNALGLQPQEIVSAITGSGLRGRGGAAFPTGIKWQTVLDTPSDAKYIVCNADEGDSGTYADRMIMESDPFTLLEGMTIAGLAVGAEQGYIYLREEYRLAETLLNAAIKSAEQAGFLGDAICGTTKAFNVTVRLGAGAYICGEETALIESLEGKRGMVRAKPPLPAIKGLWQKPTVINNVISLATVPIVLARGADFYADFGAGRSRGTLPIQLAGNLKRTGLVELAFGCTLAQLLMDFGGGSRSGNPLRSVQVGGPLGAYLPESSWQTPIDYEAFSGIGAVLGHGGVIAFDDTIDMSEQARFAMEFCAVESCGKCTPCRIGSTRGVEVIDRIRDQRARPQDRMQNVALLKDLCETMELGSLCAMGGMTHFPVLSALEHFPEDFHRSDIISTDASFHAEPMP